MTNILYHYIIDSNSECFQDNHFQDSSLFREWLLRDRNDTEHSDSEKNYQFVYAIVQEMSQFRFRAEEYFKTHDYVAKSKVRELPVLNQEIISKLMEADSTQEAPETVISRIAQNQIHVIDVILIKVRKVLRRERELTKISSVQQLDSQCMIWLTRQPGITAVQKAGIKQKLMSIVRTESYDILENRVLKAVLQLCISYCQHYLRQYGDDFMDTLRIKAVTRLLHTAMQGLRLEFMQSVSTQVVMPKPNYVLLHDQQYSQIWQMYLNLLQQTSLMENAWRYRHNLFRQYLLFCFANAICFEYKNTIIFSSNFWFSTNIKQDGLFIKKSSFQRVFLVDKHPYCFSPREENFLDANDVDKLYTAEIKCAEYTHRISAIYLPAYIKSSDLEYPQIKNHTFFIYSENPVQIPPKRADIIMIDHPQDMFFTISDQLKNFLVRTK